MKCINIEKFLERAKSYEHLIKDKLLKDPRVLQKFEFRTFTDTTKTQLIEKAAKPENISKAEKGQKTPHYLWKDFCRVLRASRESTGIFKKKNKDLKFLLIELERR